MSATFTPNFGLSINDAASICGYDHFNWYQTVTNDPYAPGGQTVPYVDPPTGGGSAFGGCADALPFYWDEGTACPTGSGLHLADNLTATSLSYFDAPQEPSLTGSEFLGFLSTLAGVNADGTFDILYAWDWKSNYTGTTGGVFRRGTNDFDPGGSGAIFRLETGSGRIRYFARSLTVADSIRCAEHEPFIPAAVSAPPPAGLLAIGLLGLLFWPGGKHAALENPRCKTLANSILFCSLVFLIGGDLTRALAADEGGRFALKGVAYSSCIDYRDARNRRDVEFGKYAAGRLSIGIQPLRSRHHQYRSLAKHGYSTRPDSVALRGEPKSPYVSMVDKLLAELHPHRLRHPSEIIEVASGSYKATLYREVVRNIQTKLRALGYLTPAPSGIYDAPTSDAIKVFQRTIGAEDTGFPDQETLFNLFFK